MPRRDQDKALTVKFEQHSVYNKARSEGEKILHNDGHEVGEVKGEGRAIFDNVDYITIVCASDPASIPCRPATCCDPRLLLPGAKEAPCRSVRLNDCDVHRFYDEWLNYKRGQTDQDTGTPLRKWAGITAAEAEELAADKIYTVEALAGLHDSAAGRYLSLRTRARDYLASADKIAQTQSARAENDALRAQLQSMAAQLEQLTAQSAQAKAAQPKAKEAR